VGRTLTSQFVVGQALQFGYIRQMRKCSRTVGRGIVILAVWIQFFVGIIGLQSAPNQSGQVLRIGFWNVRDLSVVSRDANEQDQIASVMQAFDCVAVCEVNDGSILASLNNRLKAQGGKWSYVQTSTNVGNTKSSAERYGFLYRADKLKVKGRPHVLPQISYTVTGEAPRKFDREPFTTSFKTLDGRFDFTMIVVHITWGAKPAYRIGEILALTNYFNRVQAASARDNDVILCGDFNRNVGDAPSLRVLTTSIPGLIDTTSANTPTKIDTDNTYDHLMFQTNFLTEYTGTHGVVKFDEELFGNDDDQASIVCSDHRPIWAEFRVPPRDDD
jgi:endonuclease/exonuclease/phosphatase family metal-dependent hydrolase